MQRKPVIRIAMAAAIGLAVASAISFSSTAQPVPVISWADVEKAIEAHPAIAKAKAAQAAASAELEAAKEYPNPSIAAAAGPAFQPGPGKALPAWSLDLSIPLEWVAERAYRKKAALAGIEASEMETRALGIEVERELRAIFVSVACDQVLVEALREAASHLAGVEAAWALRVDLGDKQGADLSRVQAELAKAELAASKAETRARANRDHLGLWLGGDLPQEFTVAMDIEDLAPVPQLAGIVASASTANPLVLAADLEIEKAKSLVGAEKQAAFPDISLGAFLEDEPDLLAFGGMLSMTLPLWSWNRAAVDLALAGKMEAESTKALLVLELSSQAIGAHSAATAARQAAVAYKDTVIPKLEKAAADVEKAWLLGEADLIDLIDARRSLATSRVEYVDALREFHLAMADLEALTEGGAP